MFKIKNNTILIIGYIPPPIGGLAIHVNRLLHVLENRDIKFKFINYRKSGALIRLIPEILKFRIIHLHSANPLMRLLLTLFCTLTGKKIILTIHGNLGRYNWIKNQADLFAVKIAYIPILINQDSFQIAQKLNQKSMFLSAFIPPEKETFPPNLSKEIMLWRRKFNRIFCTNAFKYKLDKKKNEIYGIMNLFKIFNAYQSNGLIISDPAGDYKAEFEKAKIILPENIFMISIPHSFVEVIKLSDILIRATTTDGDSLSVKEALFLGKNVIASDCVKRPEGCILYNTEDIDSLKKKILDEYPANSEKHTKIKDGGLELISLYKTLMV